MKQLLVSLIFLISPLGFLQSTSTGELIVHVTGLKNDDGEIKIGLANSKENYKSKGKTFKSGISTINNKRSVYHFRNIPYGRYAVRLFHDENINHKLDFTFYGKPKEAYGFSNNARGLFSPPSYKKASFELSQQTLEIQIQVE